MSDQTTSVQKLLICAVPLGGIIVGGESKLVLLVRYAVDEILTTHELKLPFVGEDVRVLEFEILRETVVR